MDRPGEVTLPEPLAYFLTWPTYGTWLPGDERGWARHGRGFQFPDPLKKLEAKARMAEDACRLDTKQRHLVEATIARHCQDRGWTLHAVNCRSNHLHVVLTAAAHPDDVWNQLKAWCTRKLKEMDLDRLQNTSRAAPQPRERWWAERGSKRFINDPDDLESAIL